jgi:hypothetical protein
MSRPPRERGTRISQWITQIQECWARFLRVRYTDIRLLTQWTPLYSPQQYSGRERGRSYIVHQSFSPSPSAPFFWCVFVEIFGECCVVCTACVWNVLLRAYVFPPPPHTDLQHRASFQKLIPENQSFDRYVVEINIHRHFAIWQKSTLITDCVKQSSNARFPIAT